MNIVIYLDQFSGHLFHDLELYIVAFEKLQNLNYECYNIYFVKPTKNFDEKKINNNWNSLLCYKLFKKTNYNIINNAEPFLTEALIIKRDLLDHKNINKAFTTSIIKFPTKLWSDCFDNKSINNFKILYAIRINTKRCLDTMSHEYLCDIVKSLNGTICNLSDLTFENQIEIFQNHNIIIGVHGNNLSGIMWMKPKSHVFEILPLKFKDKVYDYQCLSLCMQANYTQIDCSADDLNSTYTFNENSIYTLEYYIKLLINLYSY